MRRRSFLQALAGLVGAKSLPAAAPVKIPASLQVAKAAAMANPMFYCTVVGKDGKVGMYGYSTTPTNTVTVNRVA